MVYSSSRRSSDSTFIPSYYLFSFKMLVIEVTFFKFQVTFIAPSRMKCHTVVLPVFHNRMHGILSSNYDVIANCVWNNVLRLKLEELMLKNISKQTDTMCAQKSSPFKVNDNDSLKSVNHAQQEGELSVPYFVILLFTWICHLDLSKLKLIAGCDRCHA